MTPELLGLICITILALFTMGCKQYMVLIIVIGVLIASSEYYKKQQISSSSDKISGFVSTNELDLKKTPNPRASEIVSDKTPVRDVEHVRSSINAEEYTQAGMQKKREERMFSQNANHYQTTSSRATLLNTLYEEMINESVKQDPYLRSANQPEKQSLRGQRRLTAFYD